MPYVTTCPRCGAALSPHVGFPHSAPWLCHCGRSWWPSELTPQARAAYRPEYDDFGYDGAVRAAVEADVAAAHDRGTSLVDEHLPIAHVDALKQAVDWPGVHPDVSAAARRAVKDRS